MNDEDLGTQLGRSIDARVGRAKPPSDFDDVLTQSAQLQRQRRHRLVVVMSIVALAVGAVGFFVGSSLADDGTTTAVVVPRASSEADVYEPADLAQAGVEISTAFRDVFGPA